MAQARIITLGCRLNTFESAIMRANTAGLEPAAEMPLTSTVRPRWGTRLQMVDDTAMKR